MRVAIKRLTRYRTEPAFFEVLCSIREDAVRRVQRHTDRHDAPSAGHLCAGR